MASHGYILPAGGDKWLSNPCPFILHRMHRTPDLHQGVGEVVATSGSNLRFEVFVGDPSCHVRYPAGENLVGDDDAVGIVVLRCCEDLGLC